MRSNLIIPNLKYLTGRPLAISNFIATCRPLINQNQQESTRINQNHPLSTRIHSFLAWGCWKFKFYLPYCGKYPKLLSTLWNNQCVFHKIIHILNHLEYFCHISSIKPTDLRGLPQILPQSAKFLPRACLRRSRNIPSLGFSTYAAKKIINNLCHWS